jgi:putative holliday junction resolvase
MKYLALDIGQTNTGLATTDKTGSICMPYKVIKEKNIKNLAKKIFDIYDELKIDVILVGYPTNIDGTKSNQTQYVDNFLKELKKFINKESIITVDEKYSTIIADTKLKELGLNRKKRSKIIDSSSALLLLKDYLFNLN